MTIEPFQNDALKSLRWPLRLTLWGMFAERITRAFWPLWSVCLVVIAALMLGLQDMMPVEAVWAIAVVAIVAALAALIWGARAFQAPRRDEALDRLDRTLPGRPITALGDTQAIGSGDPASQLVWKAHVARMAAKVADARAVEPDLRVSDRDPYALRFVAVLAFAMALLFGSVLRVASVAEMTPGAGANALAAGPSWEGWIEPPAYTGKPSLYLNDIDQASFSVPEASKITLRLYGEVGALAVSETVSGRIGEVPSLEEDVQNFEVMQSGTLTIAGPGGKEWIIDVIDDALPEITAVAEPERGVTGEMRQTFSVKDDYGVVAGRAEITLDLDAVDRRYGLTMAPEPREMITLDLPMTISGNRAEFEETLIENLSEHPWATLPIRLDLFAQDALGQEGAAPPTRVILPGRRFFDPLAGAIVEQRRDILWNRENGARAAQILRAISNRPDDIFRSETAYLKLRVALRRLELLSEYNVMSAEQRDEIAQALWDVALLIEDGNLSDARERLRQARERLQEAMRNGATDEEIAELMQELREAMQDYMQQLAQQQGEDGQDQAQNQQNSQEITGDQLQQLMDRLQELMEQGRMDEAQELLDRLAQMMENMQVTQGQNGQQSPGQQAMEGLADTLRQQQGLSDETFGDLQEQFQQPGEGQQPGEQPGQGQQPGQQPGQMPGQGQQSGQGQGKGQGQGQAQNGQPQPGQGGDQPGVSQESLANRQQALRDELNRQAGQMPGAGTPEGDAAREALGRAGEAMDDAEESLRQDDLAGALDNQSEAIEALRDGMRNLGEAMAQQQQQQGQQGEGMGQAQAGRERDPLGREPGANGQIGTDENLLQGEDVYRRARELLDEIRRRSGDQTRTEEELDYLRRLLERF